MIPFVCAENQIHNHERYQQTVIKKFGQNSFKLLWCMKHKAEWNSYTIKSSKSFFDTGQIVFKYHPSLFLTLLLQVTPLSSINIFSIIPTLQVRLAALLLPLRLGSHPRFPILQLTSSFCQCAHKYIFSCSIQLLPVLLSLGM